MTPPLRWVNFPRKSWVSFNYKSTPGAHYKRLDPATAVTESSLSIHDNI